MFELVNPVLVEQAIDRMDPVGGVFRHGMLEEIEKALITLLAGPEFLRLGNADVDRDIDADRPIELCRRCE